jgi:hypothetical protein
MAARARSDAQLAVLAIRLVELEHRELGVVLRRDPFVAEVPVDLVDPLEAADHEALQIELRRDPQEELHIERVVVRHERPGERASGKGLHHRRLDFEVAASVQEAANAVEDPAPDLEHPARIRIDDQIQVALAVAGLDVLQPVPFLRHRDEALGQELELRRPDRQLVGLCSKEVPLDADEIAEVQQLEHREVALAERILPDIDLDLRGAVRDDEKVRLAEAPDRQHAAGGGRLDLRGLERIAGLRLVGRDQLGDSIRAREGMGVRRHAEALELLEVRAPLAQLIGFLLLGGLLLFSHAAFTYYDFITKAPSHKGTKISWICLSFAA